jgi:hypothetical protein
MKYVSRADQAPATVSLMSLAGRGLSDALLNTPKLPRPIKALRWLSEADVHSGLRITAKLKNSNQFFANQVMVVRDEIRSLTWVATIETDGIYLSRIEGNHLASHDIVSAGEVSRATLTLRKFDGLPLVTFIQIINGKGQLFINKFCVGTTADNIDFPCLAIEQPPIGFAALEAPMHAVLTYKEIETGRSIARHVDPNTLICDTEVDLQLPSILGGVAVAISNGRTLGKIELIQGQTVIPATLDSIDYFATSVAPKPIDLTAVPHDRVVPAQSRLFIDNTGIIHASLLVEYQNDSIVLDSHLDDGIIVAAVSDTKGTHSLIEAFPKMPALYDGLRFGYGDGETDGAGVIATLLSNGRLFASNSQSGGYTYPDAGLLNDDMQRMYLHAQTECYTRNRPNYVSMDYAFIESDESGNPVSAELWLETWDMPLPLPEIEHTWEGDRLRLRILRDGWFFPGQTSFLIEPTVAEITRADFVDYREMTLEFNAPERVKGTTITFETKNVFFYYQASVIV